MNSPSYDAAGADHVPYLDISGDHNSDDATLTFFAVNRHPREEAEVEISLVGFGPAALIDQQVMTHPDLNATNTLNDQTAVVPTAGSAALEGDRVTVTMPPHSFQVLRMTLLASPRT